MNEEEIIKNHYSKLGKKGGASLRAKMGSEYFAALGKRSGEAKREKKKLSTENNLTKKQSVRIIQVLNKFSKKLAK